jgi:hypothetical protein
MHLLIIVYRLLPAALTGMFIFQFDIKFSGLALLILFLINKIPNHGEDLGRMEHKIDSLAKETLSLNDLVTNYGKLHRSAWDQEYPMRPDDELVALGKKRLYWIFISDCIAWVLWIVYLLAWGYFYIFST